MSLLMLDLLCKGPSLFMSWTGLKFVVAMVTYTVLQPGNSFRTFFSGAGSWFARWFFSKSVQLSLLVISFMLYLRKKKQVYILFALCQQYINITCCFIFVSLMWWCGENYCLSIRNMLSPWFLGFVPSQWSFCTLSFMAGSSTYFFTSFMIEDCFSLSTPTCTRLSIIW